MRRGQTRWQWAQAGCCPDSLACSDGSLMQRLGGETPQRGRMGLSHPFFFSFWRVNLFFMFWKECVTTLQQSTFSPGIIFPFSFLTKHIFGPWDLIGSSLSVLTILRIPDWMPKKEMLWMQLVMMMDCSVRRRGRRVGQITRACHSCWRGSELWRRWIWEPFLQLGQWISFVSRLEKRCGKQWLCNLRNTVKGGLARLWATSKGPDIGTNTEEKGREADPLQTEVPCCFSLRCLDRGPLSEGRAWPSDSWQTFLPLLVTLFTLQLWNLVSLLKIAPSLGQLRNEQRQRSHGVEGGSEARCKNRNQETKKRKLGEPQCSAEGCSALKK